MMPYCVKPSPMNAWNMSLSCNPHPSTSTDGTLKDDGSTTTLHQLAKSFILLEASIKKIDDLECQLEDANGRLDVIDFYDQNPPSDDDEGEYDEERWDRIKEDLEVQLEKLKLERADRMLDLVQ